jgi:hypothetical protein
MRSRLEAARTRLERLQGHRDKTIACDSRRRATDELVATLHAVRAQAAAGTLPGIFDEEWLERRRHLRQLLAR